MAQLKTGTKIGQTTLNQGAAVTVTLPAVAGTLLTEQALSGLISDTDPRLSDARTPTAHAHAISDVTGLQTALDGKVDDSQVLTNVPAGAEFTDTVYTHPTTAGNKHIPAGGAAGQILKYSADGTAVWGDSTGGASVTTYSVTIPSASWTGSSAPYTKTVTVTGLLTTDEPIIDVNLTGTYATDQTIRTNWSKVYDGDTATNSITFYADAVPTADIPVRIKVIR